MTISKTFLLASIITCIKTLATGKSMESTSQCSIASLNYCPTFTDNFDTLDRKFWIHEINNDGGGNGEFQEYVDNRSNSFVKDGILYLKPTVNGNSLQSARLVSKGTLSTRYGRVEVKARLPKGDWIWPAIWMMPKDSVYGVWPISGEIDIMESRGNDESYGLGVNSFGSTLHWGKAWNQNRWFLTHEDFKLPKSNFNADFHIFGLEWTPNSLRTYLDTPSNVILEVPLSNFDAFNKGFFSGSNPWKDACPQAPFDQEFYMIFNVAVGGTNGFFDDNLGGKPWSNGDGNAKFKFFEARDKWLPTWDQTGENSSMAIDSITISKLC